MRARQAVLIWATVLARSSFCQVPAPPSEARQKLQLNAELVLSKEFCNMRQRESIGIRDVLRIGAAACPKIESAFRGVFASVYRVESLPAAGTRSGEITLTPRFVQLQATRPMMPTSQRKLVVVVE